MPDREALRVAVHQVLRETREADSYWLIADTIVDAVMAVEEEGGRVEWAYRYPNGHVATWIPQLMTEDLARSVVAEHPDLLTVVCRRVTRWEDTDDRST